VTLWTIIHWAPLSTGFSRQEYWSGGEEFRNNRYILLHIKWIINKVLLYSTESYTQYLAIVYNGEESEKEHVYNITEYNIRN